MEATKKKTTTTTTTPTTQAASDPTTGSTDTSVSQQPRTTTKLSSACDLECCCSRLALALMQESNRAAAEIQQLQHEAQVQAKRIKRDAAVRSKKGEVANAALQVAKQHLGLISNMMNLEQDRSRSLAETLRAGLELLKSAETAELGRRLLAKAEAMPEPLTVPQCIEKFGPSPMVMRRLVDETLRD
eukprot:TRINITY_DN15274_c0_g1_i1.p1 TRINITY_DN15274_c0_g1~~TRINITY_DN15274_c0_g1_i1.p1  ORF type:complete len:187 (+),score=36.80 TRINITY_DN15274_c0_g1_i1:10-570(+)